MSDTDETKPNTEEPAAPAAEQGRHIRGKIGGVRPQPAQAEQQRAADAQQTRGHIAGQLRPPPGPSATEWLTQQEADHLARANKAAAEAEQRHALRVARGKDRGRF
jgi:hypothetical protein